MVNERIVCKSAFWYLKSRISEWRSLGFLSSTIILLEYNNSITCSPNFSCSLLRVILLATTGDSVLDFNENASSAVVFNYLIFLLCGKGCVPWKICWEICTLSLRYKQVRTHTPPGAWAPSSSSPRGSWAAPESTEPDGEPFAGILPLGRLLNGHWRWIIFAWLGYSLTFCFSFFPLKSAISVEF